MQRNLWAVTGLYVAGIIGAGFASGQELTVFFVNYGWGGLLGIVLAVIILFVGTGLTLQFSAKFQVSSYGQIFAVLDPKLKIMFELFYALFLITGIAVMYAGIGAMGQTSLAGLLWRIGSAFFVFIVLCRGVEGVLRMSAWIAPSIVAVLCIIAFRFLQPRGLVLSQSGDLRGLEAGILYACYNLGFSLAVLASIHQYLPTSRQRWQLAFAGSIILGTCMIMLYFALASLTPQQLEHPFPMINLLTSWGSVPIGVYKIMLWGAMYTTVVANSLALVSRLTELTPRYWSQVAFGVVVFGVVLSYLGFVNLIRIAYPILGLAGLWILAHLLRQSVV